MNRRMTKSAATTRAAQQKQKQHGSNSRNNSNDPPRLQQQQQQRRLDADDAVVPGRGWTITNHPVGFCDGTANAQCNRDADSSCLMGGHMDGRGLLLGDGLSGWVVFQLRNVTQGIVMARVETWHGFFENPRTDGWTEVNEGVGGTEGRQRDLKKKVVPPLPDDFHIEVAVNGVITKRFNNTETRLALFAAEVAYNVAITVLLDDEERAKKNVAEDIELGIRITTPVTGRKYPVAFSHLYYA